MDIYEIAIYGITFTFIGWVIYNYLEKAKKLSLATQAKVDAAHVSDHAALDLGIEIERVEAKGDVAAQAEHAFHFQAEQIKG